MNLSRLLLAGLHFSAQKQVIYSEVNMAKRRNQKKEKALRNEAYARKFRKRANTGRFGRRRNYNDNRSTASESNEQEQSQDGAGVAASE